MKGIQTRLTVQVQPNANQNELLGFKQGILYVRIAAPPMRGKANQELIKYLGDILSITKSQATIQKGTTSKRKLISIGGLNQDQVMEKLADWLNEHKTKKQSRKLPE
jgi:uncharacterized protein (TIGR00251 family)